MERTFYFLQMRKWAVSCGWTRLKVIWKKQNNSLFTRCISRNRAERCWNASRRSRLVFIFVSQTVCQLKTKTLDPPSKECRVCLNFNLTCHSFNSDTEGLFPPLFLGWTVVGGRWPRAQIMTLTSVNSFVPSKWSVHHLHHLHHLTDERLLCCPARLRLEWDISPILRVYLDAVGDHPLHTNV